jgi:hypothetical protein
MTHVKDATKLQVLLVALENETLDVDRQQASRCCLLGHEQKIKPVLNTATSSSMLVLCTHVIDAGTASVPLHIMQLQGILKNGAIPPEFKLRQVIPTKGTHSSSLWDVEAPDAIPALTAWLEESLQGYCVNHVSEVPEAQSYGLGWLLGGRLVGDATEKTRQVVGSNLAAIDSTLKISERAALATDVAKGTIAGVSTGASKVAGRVLENEVVSASVTRIGASWGWATSKFADVYAKASGTDVSGSSSSDGAGPAPADTEIPSERMI